MNYMNLDKEWKKFLESNKELKRESFIKYCLNNIKESDKGNLTIQQASYNICAACSQIHDDEDKNIVGFEDIENISCDLELPTEHRSISLDEWDNLKKIIGNINKK